jgi:zinc D-Ala-D-Ala dipeptidase
MTPFARRDSSTREVPERIASSGLRLLLPSAWLSLVLLTAISSAQAGEAPNDFVYLRDVDPSIEQDMRYAGSNNFTGKPVPGYAAGECMLVRQAAEALKGVQAELKAKELALKVYDCYRPARAVAAFVDWAKEPDDPAAKQTYYPALPKSGLFPDYIATRSSHSRGATVDLTIVPSHDARDLDIDRARDSLPCTEQEPSDNSLDMGTAFDCFDPKANTDAPGLTDEQSRNRKLLVEVMGRHGFENYPMEIWHFTLVGEPYPDTIFDFPIGPRPTDNKE